MPPYPVKAERPCRPSADTFGQREGAFTVIVDGGIGRRGDHDEGRKGSVGNANELLYYLIIMMWGGLLIPS